jgi:hypothetical protein
LKGESSGCEKCMQIVTSLSSVTTDISENIMLLGWSGQEDETDWATSTHQEKINANVSVEKQ